MADMNIADALATKRKPGPGEPGYEGGAGPGGGANLADAFGAGGGSAAPTGSGAAGDIYNALAGPQATPPIGPGAGGAAPPVGVSGTSQPPAAAPTPDPFTAMGGGTFIGGGWIPNNNPDAIARARAASGQAAGPAAAGPSASTVAPPPAGAPADPFAASGGGTFIGGGWIPNNNPDAIAKARAASGEVAPPANPPGGPGTGIPGVTGDPPPLRNPTDSLAPPAGPPATVNDAFKKALMTSLSKPIGVDANDPTIKAQTDAFSNAQTRAKQRDREALAGRAAATGQLSDLSSGGAFDEGLSNLEQRQGEAEAGFNANLTGQELNKQRDELYRYAALAGNQLSGEEGRALQEKIANLNAQIQREQMAQQGGQFKEDIGLRRELGKDQVGLGQGDLNLRGELGKGGLNLNLLQLLTGDKNFGQDLSARLGMFGAGQDNQLWQALLGGM